MKNSEKIILDLCGGTGSWSKPYRESGYDVRLITLPDNDVGTYQPPENVYGILAAPPCTMFSLARTTPLTPRNFSLGMKTVKHCLEIIWQCRERKKLKFWALENPTGILRQFLGKPFYTFDPSQLGEFYNKKTDLWGFFNPPKKHRLIRYQSTDRNTRQLPQIPLDYKRDPNMTSLQIRRSITSSLFANAFFKANQ